MGMVALPCAARQGKLVDFQWILVEHIQSHALHDVVVLLMGRLVDEADIVQSDTETNVVHAGGGAHLHLERTDSFRQIQ